MDPTWPGSAVRPNQSHRATSGQHGIWPIRFRLHAPQQDMPQSCGSHSATMTLHGKLPQRRITYMMLTYVAWLASYSVAFNYSQGLRPCHAGAISSLTVVFSRRLLRAYTMLVNAGCSSAAISYRLEHRLGYSVLRAAHSMLSFR